ncbi:MAG: hypothetical protein EOP06_22615 [Proteobacteria bacterium]|nr:MAG: hypothetical protein EOP06_22615 [Pseudomonadota bacterium]
MKKLLVLFCAILFAACGDDDAPSKPILTSINVFGGEPLTLEYYKDRTVRTITFPDGLEFGFTYQDKRIKTITRSGFLNPGTYTFQYDGDEIQSYEYLGQIYTPIYNQPENPMNNGITLYDDGQIKTFTTITGSYTISYDRSKKGSFYNANDINLHLMLIDSSFWQACVLFSKYPITNVSGEEDIIITNQFNDDGYLELNQIAYLNATVDCEFIYENK